MKCIRMMLRWFCSNVPIRGRYRLANTFGKHLAPQSEEIIDIGGVAFPIDHSIEMYRYIFYGVYEEHFVNFLRRSILPGDTVVEPGANVGYISAILSTLVGEHGMVYSLEPSKICYAKLKLYLKKQNVTLLNKAIADVDGDVDFVDTSRVITRGYSAMAAYMDESDSGSKYSIPAVTVDTLAKQFGLLRIKLLKLDVEGAELIALKGGVKMLSNKSIDYILVETTFSDAYKESNLATFELLTGFGYSCHLMTRDGLKPLAFVSESNSRHDVIWKCR